MADSDSKEEQARRLKRARIHARYATAVDAWRALDATDRDAPSKHTYLQHENGTRSLKNEAQTYARFYDVPVEWLLYGQHAPDWADGDQAEVPAEPPRLGVLPVRGTVQAGAWLEIDLADQRVAEEEPAPVDPRFPAKYQWLSRVAGTSMNALERNGKPYPILDGDYVHCVSTYAIDYRPKHEDVVEVERRRFQGREIELTVKQIHITADGKILLCPRSTDPRWQKPIPYEGETDDIEVRVRGLVLGINRRFA